MWENHDRQTFSSLRREMPLSLWVKSLKAFAGCGILKNSAITKADGFVREHLRNRGKEMEQKGTPESSPHISSCPSYVQITVDNSHPGGKAGVKMIEGCVAH